MIWSGDDGGGVPRVPIPNTTVKPSSADGTWTAGSWESRTSPGRISERSTLNRVLFCVIRRIERQRDSSITAYQTAKRSQLPGRTRLTACRTVNCVESAGPPGSREISPRNPIAHEPSKPANLRSSSKMSSFAFRLFREYRPGSFSFPVSSLIFEICVAVGGCCSISRS